MTTNITTAAEPATLGFESFEDELEYAIIALREEGGIELAAMDTDHLLARIEDSDMTAQNLREVARLFEKYARIVGHAPGGVGDWSAMSHYAKLKELARFCDNDVREKLDEVAEELRLQSMADLEEDAYRTDNISRSTLVARLVEIANGDAGILKWFRTESRFAYAWHDDTAEFYEGGAA